MSSTLIRGATVVTMNDRLDVLEGCVAMRDGRITSVGDEPPGSWDAVADARDGALIWNRDP